MVSFFVYTVNNREIGTEMGTRRVMTRARVCDHMIPFVTDRGTCVTDDHCKCWTDPPRKRPPAGLFHSQTRMEQRLLRILYSTNDSTQYVLARSRSLIPVYPLASVLDGAPDGTRTQTRTRYASVSIKACVDTLCLSSPDLIQDRTRDFSVYHLDPLESVGPVCNGSQSSEAVGVPVGLGLMSGLRAADGNLPVTGTLTKLRTGLEALEVVFNLREVSFVLFRGFQ